MNIVAIQSWTDQGNSSALVNALESVGFGIVQVGMVWSCNDAQINAAQAFIDGWAGPLAYNKAQKQISLDANFDTHFDLAKFIRGGSATGVTAANVGTFLAQITNNYRSLRASIAGAANQGALDAININAGWPSNP